MIEGFLYLWFSYILIRQTRIDEFKCMKTAGIMTRRTFGMMFCLFGIERLIFDHGGWLNQLSEFRNILPYLVLIVMPFGLIISWFFDVKNSLRADTIPFSQTRFKEQPLSLITWDMWLVTGMGLFFLIYSAISI